jgi:hypothetical protein
MNYLIATLHTFGIRLGDRARASLHDDSERGSATIENVMWAVAVIAFVGIVTAVIKAYVTSKSGLIK